MSEINDMINSRVKQNIPVQEAFFDRNGNLLLYGFQDISLCPKQLIAVGMNRCLTTNVISPAHPMNISAQIK